MIGSTSSAGTFDERLTVTAPAATFVVDPDVLAQFCESEVNPPNDVVGAVLTVGAVGTLTVVPAQIILPP